MWRYLSTNLPLVLSYVYNISVQANRSDIEHSPHSFLDDGSHSQHFVGKITQQLLVKEIVWAEDLYNICLKSLMNVVFLQHRQHKIPLSFQNWSTFRHSIKWVYCKIETSLTKCFSTSTKRAGKAAASAAISDKGFTHANQVPNQFPRMFSGYFQDNFLENTLLFLRTESLTITQRTTIDK